MERELTVTLKIPYGRKGHIEISDQECGCCAAYTGIIGSDAMRRWIADEIVSWLELMSDEVEG